MPRLPLDRAVEVLLANPYTGSLAVHTEADRAIEGVDVPAAVQRFLAAGERGRAEGLILAAGHHQACVSGGDPAEILTRSTLPEPLRKQLPRPASAYVRIAAAAGRCHAALDALRGSSAAMRQTRAEAWAACFGDSLLHALSLERLIVDHDVLILGETGTGKEGLARAIQAATPGGPGGAAAPSAAINAAAVPETLVESALFGHVKGAFTGAITARPGLLKTADGGTFFLDEVGDLPSTTQVKLLRVIEENELYPVGADRPEQVNCRYVAATHKDLEAMVERGEFRRDLFQRLAGNVIRLPPLRERPADIAEIGMAFVAQAAGAPPPKTLAATERWLRSAEARAYPWPGNVRELQNVLRNLLLGLPPGLRGAAPPPPASDDPPAAIRDGAAPLQRVEDWYLRRVLERHDGNHAAASRSLGIDRSTLKRRLAAGVRVRRDR